MLRLLLIDVVAALVLLGLWYLLFATYNRRKGVASLRWVQAACAGKGRILDSRWLGSSRLDVRLQFPSRSFENARVTMKLRPRALPIQWLVSCWRRQKETLTFEADLGGSPSFHLQVLRHRWCAHSSGVQSRHKVSLKKLGINSLGFENLGLTKLGLHKLGMQKEDSREWDLYQPGPIVLTTRTHWKQDPTPEINALMTVRHQDVLQVHFRPDSPQFSATMALDALSDPEAAAGFLTTLRELAAGASAHRQ